MKKVFNIVVLIVFSFQSQAQISEVLTHFTALELNGKVLLSWGINSGQTCNGIKIYRSVNNSNFIEIGEINGVCGSSVEAINYTFRDEYPIKNQDNLYRLDLGGYGNSEVITQFVTSVKNVDFEISPNPVVSTSKLFFKNPRSNNYTIKIYNTSGQEIKSIGTTDNFYELKASIFQRGIYFITVTSESNQLISSGKMVIQ